MKNALLAFLLFVTFNSYSQNQTISIFEKARKASISNYFEVEKDTLVKNEYRILLSMKYGSASIQNYYDISKINLGQIHKINLYYSNFPENTNFDRLNKRRIEMLLSYDEMESIDSIEWTIVEQTACKNRTEARELFHGFEIILEQNSILDITQLPVDTNFNDFVVNQVLKRNDWTEMLVVMDMTGSMSPYIVQLFLWLQLNTLDDKVKQFAFFNDGDTQLDHEKMIGKTGGIYHTRSKVYEEIEEQAIRCIVSGNGSDWQENDIEALLKGMELCPDCREHILIADNSSPMRDFRLLEKIKKPIRVIVCGATPEYGINVEYLDLARATGGSIHLLEEDFFNLMQVNEGEKIGIGNYRYQILNGKFVQLERL